MVTKIRQTQPKDRIKNHFPNLKDEQVGIACKRWGIIQCVVLNSEEQYKELAEILDIKLEEHKNHSEKFVKFIVNLDKEKYKFLLDAMRGANCLKKGEELRSSHIWEIYKGFIGKRIGSENPDVEKYEKVIRIFEQKYKTKKEFPYLAEKDFDTACRRWDSFLKHLVLKEQYEKLEKEFSIDQQQCKNYSEEFIKFIVSLDEEQYESLKHAILEANNLPKDGKLKPHHIQEFRKGFFAGRVAGEDLEREIKEEDREKYNKAIKIFQEKLQTNLDNLYEKNEVAPHRKNEIAFKQTLNQLQPDQKGLLNKLMNFVKDKTGFDPHNPMKSLFKFLPGGNKQDHTKAVADSKLDIPTGKSLITGELIGKVLGFGGFSSFGFIILPLIPVYLIRKVVPEGILPLVGGLTVSGMLAEGTAWNPIDKNTKVLVGEENKAKPLASNHASNVTNQRARTQQSIPCR